MIQYDVKWCNIILYDIIWFEIIWYYMILYDIIWYYMILYDTLWSYDIHHSVSKTLETVLCTVLLPSLNDFNGSILASQQQLPSPS